MRVVNSLLLKDNKILLLHKPSRNKWFLPGGKAEFGEDIVTTGCREFVEETGLSLISAKLTAATTVVVKDNEETKEWLLFTLKATDATGELMPQTREGILRWHDAEAIETLAMFEGDRFIVKTLLEQDELISSTQVYTPSYELIELQTNNLK